MYTNNTCIIPPDPSLVKKLKEEYKKEKKKNKMLTEVEFFVKKDTLKIKYSDLTIML
jgi:hypothetical protein